MVFRVFEQYIDKRVVVTQKDGFRKFGIFLYSDELFIYLKFNNSDIPVSIAISEIKGVAEDQKADGVSR